MPSVQTSARHIVITGASSGIGYAIAKDFAQSGWTVWAGVRQTGALKDLTTRFPNLRECQLDVTNDADIKLVYDQVEASKPVQVCLVNNAGISGGGPIEGASLEVWRKVFDVNLFAVVRMTQIFLPLIRATRGRIVNMGSLSGYASPPMVAIYSASKYALRAESDALRVEMRKFGVGVSLIEPGPVMTEIWNKTIKEVTRTWSEMGDEMLKLYEIPLSKITKMIDQTNGAGVPVERVAAAVRHAVTSARPRAYYPVGTAVRIKIAALTFLPAGVRDWVFDFAMKRS